MDWLGFIIPKANAAFDTAAFVQVLNPVISQIVYPVLYVLFTLAVFLFAYGVIKMFVISGDEASRSQGRMHILFGAIGMFIMMSAWGIVYFVSDSLKSLKGDLNGNSSGQNQTIDPAGELNI